MEQTELGKEPGNWELYRGIERVEKAVHDISVNSVSAAVFAIEKASLEGKITALERADTEHKASTLATDKKLTDYAKEQDAQKNRNRLFVYGLVASPFVAGVAGWIFSGGLSTLGN